MHKLAKSAIRAATLDDVPALHTCTQAAYEHYIERMGKAPAPMQANFTQQLDTHTIDVFTIDEQVVGYVVHLTDKAQTMLENVAVHPSHGGQGIGRALITHVETQAACDQALKIVLYTNVAMTENLAMYPKLGYIETHRIEEHGFKRVYFEKLLRSHDSNA